MSDDGDPDSSSWAPFGPGSDDEEPAKPVAPEPAPKQPGPVEEPEPEAPPVEEPPPSVAFAPPAPPPLEPLPTLAKPSALAWPDPSPTAPPQTPVEPVGQQAPWPPQGFQGTKPVPSDATVALVVGIVSIFVCGFVGPFAIHYGLKARRQIDADPSLGGRGLATWGYVLGIVSTSVLVIVLLLVAVGVIAVT